MEIRNIHHPFELDILEVSSYSARSHKNTFFEMIFILEGEGIQIVNEHKLPYNPDKLFLVFPQDKHSFEVKTFTRFLFIRFNDSYLKNQSKEWIKKVEYIFHNHNHLPGCILKTVTDKPLIRALALGLICENQKRNPNHHEVITQLINTIITIAARNITLLNESGSLPSSSKDSVSLLNYIHENIYSPEKLRTETMADQFNISATYISEYFKKHTGESLQQYITQYKIKLVETRLLYTQMRLSEICDEFGFTDLSHMNKAFKKYKGLSPTEYRKTNSKE
ncbi:transcriptional regulator [Sporocytophaga myxococcoides]|uniref:Transcriptional regulator n=1 Tax=Sporocytophaga myxococcoides TaxID=153721 RepID=A0A098LJZ9_9BACT|nr:AraC family transcriptional regulator [Sporocytophaga myxococcoides]GAL87255.1 transcriptional regulator [Sporocytophaga myxococcoides]